MQVLKIGGSVLTDKSRRNKLDRESFEQVLKTVTDHPEDLVLVHGAGSFGHPQAKEIGLGSGTRDSFYSVYRALMQLNEEIIEYLEGSGVKTFPVNPVSSSQLENNELEIFSDPVKKALEHGFLPVMHGSCVVSEDKVEAVSGDRIAVEIAERLDADRLGMCCSSCGVKDRDGEVIEVIEDMEDFPDLGAEEDDVTGGMEAKVEKLLGTQIETRIFGPGKLRDFLDGESPGTLVKNS